VASSPSSASNIDRDALSAIARSIWRAGVDAVDSARLVRRFVHCDANTLEFGSWHVDLRAIRRIEVVGAGKAGGGMARGLVEALQPLASKHAISGWINVPEGCGVDLPNVRVFEARPAGSNLPTERVISGTQEILRRVESCSADDLCIVLISGGGSALLALPHPTVTLAEQVAMIEFLASREANIQQLNVLRKQISQVKGGRLAQACRGRLVTLIISDVIGDPLDLIASGPTAPDPSTAKDALQILRAFDPDQQRVAPSIHALVSQRAAQARYAIASTSPAEDTDLGGRLFVIGNLQTAIDAAAERACALGWPTESNQPAALEGTAESVGADLVDRMWAYDGAKPHCWISGGEPVVRLVDRAQRGLGGRNQQLVLAAVSRWLERCHDNRHSSRIRDAFCILSGGTDGEDGPTDAAGAWFDDQLLERLDGLALDPSHYLERNDAYHFFQRLGALFITGPTGTNVCDLRICLLRPKMG
jgi:hydroxypyruvate reductase